MSYQVLARKWRPATFEQMVGQSHVLQALTNALSQQRLHHAYLFTGTRGVGKTSLARLFAKGLNCELGVTATPCGTCSSCVEISQGRFVDLIEVDAASRTKVDDTRELLDNVQYRPARGRFKVYLIDEVHMLSRSSFNALLKTLEEPPEHVKFLLATTDPQKLPVTVLSRCLQFNLKSLSLQEIQQQLDYVLGQERVKSEPQALNLLAKAANGSMRDALSLTDQAIAFGSGQVMLTQVQTMLGSIDERHVLGLLSSLCDGQIGPLMQSVAQVLAFGADADEVLRSLLELLHQITLSQFAPAAATQSLYSEQILAFAQQLSPEHVQLYYQILLTGRKELPFAPDPKSGLEMALLRAVAFVPEKPAKRWLVEDAAEVSLPKASNPSATAKVTNASSTTNTHSANSLETPAQSTLAISTPAALAPEQPRPSLISQEAQAIGTQGESTQDEEDTSGDDDSASDAALASEQAVLLSQASSMGFNTAAITESVGAQSTPAAPVLASAPSQASALGDNVTDQYNDYHYLADTSSHDEHSDFGYEAFNVDETAALYTQTVSTQAVNAQAVSTQAVNTQAAEPETFAPETEGFSGVGEASEAAAEVDLFADGSLLDAVLTSRNLLLADVNANAVPKEGEVKKPLMASQLGRNRPHIDDSAKITTDNALSAESVAAQSQLSTESKSVAPFNEADRPPWVAAADGSSPFAEPNTQVAKVQLSNADASKGTLEVVTASQSPESVVNSGQGSQAQSDATESKISTAEHNISEHSITGHALDLHWYKLMSQLPIGGRIRQLAVNSVCLSLESPLRLLLKPDQKHLGAEVAVIQLTAALDELLAQPVEISIEIGQDSQRETPLELRKRFHLELLQQAKQSLISDSKVQWLLNEFSAQLQEDSLVYPPEQLTQISQQIQSIGYSHAS